MIDFQKTELALQEVMRLLGNQNVLLLVIAILIAVNTVVAVYKKGR